MTASSGPDSPPGALAEPGAEKAARWPDLGRLEAVGALFQLAVYTVSLVVFRDGLKNILVIGAAVLLTVLVVRVFSGRPWTVPSRTLAGVEVAAFAVLATLAGAIPASGTNTGANPDTVTTAAGPATERTAVIGDPRAADPCALLSSADLSRFGEPHLETAYGNFNRCDVVLDSPAGEVDVRVELDRADPGTGGGIGADGVTVVRGHQRDGYCDRLLVLGDGNEVAVTAQQQGGPGPFRLCPVAERAGATAHRVLARTGAAPRRATEFDTASLARRDACTLLPAEVITRIAGIPASAPESGFANWSCRWDSSGSDLSVSLRFDQDSGLGHGEPPTRVGGRDVYSDPGGDGEHTCLARVGYRRYFDAHQDPVVELVILQVAGPGPAGQLCPAATRLAGSLSL